MISMATPKSILIRPACAGQLHSRWAVSAGKARRRRVPLSHSRICEDVFANPPQLFFVEGLGDARHRTERRRKKRVVVIARRDDEPQSKLLQRREDLENPLAAQIDVEQCAI